MNKTMISALKEYGQAVRGYGWKASEPIRARYAETIHGFDLCADKLLNTLKLERAEGKRIRNEWKRKHINERPRECPEPYDDIR